MGQKYLVVTITTPTVEVGQKIARILVGKELAACVNIVPGISSIYTWKAEICEDQEVLLIVKTRSDLFDSLSAAVAKEHPYDVPEIIAMPVVAGAASYLHWIDEVTQSS